MALSVGDPGTLFHLNLKVNTDQRGFNFKFHLKGTDYDAVMPGCVAVAKALRSVMPTDADIFYAAVSMDNTARESKFIRDALGVGTYGQITVDPPAELFDNSRSSLLVRFEIADGLWVSRKINPLPDEVITDGTLVDDIDDVVAPVTVAPGAPVASNSYPVAFKLFMSTVMFYTRFVKSGHAPGGEYQFQTWSAAYVLRQSVKKGGRVFSS